MGCENMIFGKDDVFLVSGGAGFIGSNLCEALLDRFSSEKGLNKILTLNLDSAYMFELKIIVDQIRNLNKATEEINKELIERGKKVDGHKNLTSIKGIGDLSATILLNTIGDVKDFPDDKKPAAYFGIVPRVSVSNQTSQYGRITKIGQQNSPHRPGAVNPDCHQV